MTWRIRQGQGHSQQCSMAKLNKIRLSGHPYRTPARTWMGWVSPTVVAVMLVKLEYSSDTTPRTFSGKTNEFSVVWIGWWGANTKKFARSSWPTTISLSSLRAASSADWTTKLYSKHPSCSINLFWTGNRGIWTGLHLRTVSQRRYLRREACN